MIKAVIFDVGGVLINKSPVLQEILDEFNLNEKAVDEILGEEAYLAEEADERILEKIEKSSGNTLKYFFEEEVDETTKNLSTIIEPVLLLVIGLVVGFIALAIISPIYELTGSIKK